MPTERDARQDSDSDPAESDERGQDWASEGGATTEGPATDTDNSENDDDR